MPQNRDELQVPVNTIINLQLPKKRQGISCLAGYIMY